MNWKVIGKYGHLREGTYSFSVDVPKQEEETPTLIPEPTPTPSVLGLIITFGWGSHASSLNGMKGFIAQTAHFLAVNVWIGLLFVGLRKTIKIG